MTTGGRLTVLDRYPFNSPWIRGLIGRYWLVTWFLINSAIVTLLLWPDIRRVYFK